MGHSLWMRPRSYALAGIFFTLSCSIVYSQTDVVGAPSTVDNQRLELRDQLRDLPGARKHFTSDYYVGSGTVHLELGNLQAAVLSYQEAISINPNNAEAYFDIGRAQYGLGKLQEASDNFNLALKIEPGRLEFHAARGSIRRELGDLAGAEEDFGFLRLQPDSIPR
jgi:tetratricopeptide (TPR) repeat protein